MYSCLVRDRKYWYIFVEIQSRLLCQHIGETPAQEYCFKFTAASLQLGFAIGPFGQNMAGKWI